MKSTPPEPVPNAGQIKESIGFSAVRLKRRTSSNVAHVFLHFIAVAEILKEATDEKGGNADNRGDIYYGQRWALEL